MESITRQDLVDLQEARFFPAGLMVVIVGDVPAARAVAAAERAFGDWRGPAQAPALVAPVTRVSTRQQLVLPMMSKAQADVAYGFTAVARRDPDYYALTLMNNVLGQYGLGGRLGDSIRERQGMAYYVFSSLDTNLAAGPLVIRAGVGPGNVDRTIASIDEEVRAIATRLEQLTGNRVGLETNVDPSILGGVVVRIGDRLIDGSVRGRLERLRGRLAAGTI